jgi:hypothetical protein
VSVMLENRYKAQLPLHPSVMHDTKDNPLSLGQILDAHMGLAQSDWLPGPYDPSEILDAVKYGLHKERQLSVVDVQNMFRQWLHEYRQAFPHLQRKVVVKRVRTGFAGQKRKIVQNTEEKQTTLEPIAEQQKPLLKTPIERFKDKFGL